MPCTDPSTNIITLPFKETYLLNLNRLVTQLPADDKHSVENYNGVYVTLADAPINTTRFVSSFQSLNSICAHKKLHEDGTVPVVILFALVFQLCDRL